MADRTTERFGKLGGVAAIVCGLTYVFGFAVLLAALEPAGYFTLGDDPAATMAFLSDRAGILRLWFLVIYVTNALALVVLVLALGHRLIPLAPVAGLLAQGMGLIWATLVLAAGMAANVGLAAALDAATVETGARIWETTRLIENGIGGGNEIAGGVWVLLVSLAALTSRRLPRPLAWLGLVIGVSGLLTVLNLSEAFGAVFGLGFIAWFFWTGVALLRRPNA